MDMNSSSVFDVQSLAVEPIPKSTGNVTALQKPLRRLYFSYRKNLTINPPLPHLKIVAGPQGIAFSTESPIAMQLPQNVLPQAEKYFLKDSIVSAVALQFSFHGKNKKFKGAFVTLDQEERLNQAKGYGDLFSSIDDKDLLMTNISDHSAIFVCITKSSTAKTLDAHIFICSSENQATDIVKALKGQLGPIGQTPSNDSSTLTGICETTQAIPTEVQPDYLQQPYPVGFQAQFPIGQPFYTIPQQPDQATLMFHEGYNQALYHMRMNTHAVQQPYMPPMPNQSQAPCSQSSPMQNRSQSMYVQNAPAAPDPTSPMYTPVASQFHQGLQPNTLPILLDLHDSNAPTTEPVTTFPDISPLNIQMKLPRPVPALHSSPLPEIKNIKAGTRSAHPNGLTGGQTVCPNIQTGAQGTYPIPQVAPDLRLPVLQTSQQIHPCYIPNNQLKPQIPNMDQKGFPSPFLERKAIIPSSPAGSVSSLSPPIDATGPEQAFPSGPNNSSVKQAQAMPPVPPKPAKPSIRNSKSFSNSELKHPKKVTGIRVMPVMPSKPLDDSTARPEATDKMLQNQEITGP